MLTAVEGVSHLKTRDGNVYCGLALQPERIEVAQPAVEPQARGTCADCGRERFLDADVERRRCQNCLAKGGGRRIPPREEGIPW
jgi:hypothetical protein